MELYGILWKSNENEYMMKKVGTLLPNNQYEYIIEESWDTVTQ